MTWCDQIEACTNAANMTTVWKHLKLSEKDTKIIIEAPTARDCLVLYHVFNEQRKGGCCWLLYDDWNSEMALNS